MDQIPASKGVRLRSHLGKYLVANDDGTATVRQSRNYRTRRSIWLPEPSSASSSSSIRLKNYYTGLYLAASDAAAFLMTGKRVVQSPLILPNNNSTQRFNLILDWVPIRDEGEKMKLKARGQHGNFLRANGGPPPWNNSVTHDAPATGTTKFWTLWDFVPVEAAELEAATAAVTDVWLQGNEAMFSTSTYTNTESSIFVVPSPGEHMRTHLVPGGVRTFTLKELSHATNNFNETNFLGGGGFGPVFRGLLSDGEVRDVAVKKLKGDKGQGEPEFFTEVNLLSRVHHKNLVALVGYCVSGLDRLLVYEYVENNNLAFHLRGNAASVLDWPTRMRIALGSAKGIAYLHEDCYPFKIIHQDIKSLNILLDSNLGAKVSDFGLAKCVLDNNTEYVTGQMKGTPGYMDPDIFESGKLTDKLDVYSFGVVLLELITGQKPLHLVDRATAFLEQVLEDGELFETQLIDPKLGDDFDHEEMTRMIACAAVSVRRNPDCRPQMSQVVQVLEGNISLERLKAETRSRHDDVDM